MEKGEGILVVGDSFAVIDLQKDLVLRVANTVLYISEPMSVSEIDFMISALDCAISFSRSSSFDRFIFSLANPVRIVGWDGMGNDPDRDDIVRS